MKASRLLEDSFVDALSVCYALTSFNEAMPVEVAEEAAARCASLERLVEYFTMMERGGEVI